MILEATQIGVFRLEFIMATFMLVAECLGGRSLFNERNKLDTWFIF